MSLEQLQSEIYPLQEALYTHSMYKKLNTLDALKQFMQYHVFVVWDFMNLLSFLQRTLTSVTTPWQPPQNPQLARFINQIKLEEESDIIDGEVISHFQYYVKSMSALGADTANIDQFQTLISDTDYKTLIQHKTIPLAVVPFLKNTYDCIQAGPIETASSFTFGRETIIPKMFIEILENITSNNDDVQAFKNYLDRHIELDGNEHGQLALQLMTLLCGSDQNNWDKAINSAKASIQARINLYDAISF